MASQYPQPEDVGIRIPMDLQEARYKAGFQHALEGGQLDKIEYFRRSFRLGYRAAKLYLAHQRRQRGIVNFPLQGRFRMRAMGRSLK